MAMKKFQKYLIIRPFDVLGDHRPLTTIFNMHNNTNNKKLLRWRTEICLFTFILFSPGKDFARDYLSLIKTNDNRKLNTDPAK